MDERKLTLIKLFKEKAVLKKDVTLSSGIESGFYIDGRIITLSSEGNSLVSSLLFDKIKELNITAVGGLTMGADPIVGGVCNIAGQNGYNLKGFLVRKEIKKHGMQKNIEGPSLKNEDRILVVDDVATTGGSIVKAVEALKDKGLHPVTVFVIVDREQGALQLLDKLGCKLQALISLKELGL